MLTTCALHLFASRIDSLFSETLGDGHTAMNVWAYGLAGRSLDSRYEKRKREIRVACSFEGTGWKNRRSNPHMWIAQMGSHRDCVSAPPLLFFFRTLCPSSGDEQRDDAQRTLLLPNSGYKRYQHHQHSIAIPEYPRTSVPASSAKRWRDRPYFLMTRHESFVRVRVRNGREEADRDALPRGVRGRERDGESPRDKPK
jgi:hypothetical protein